MTVLLIALVCYKVLLSSFYCVVDLHKQWVTGKTQNPESKVFTIKKDSKTFTAYFDLVQEQLETLASMDELLSGENAHFLTSNS